MPINVIKIGPDGRHSLASIFPGLRTGGNNGDTLMIVDRKRGRPISLGFPWKDVERFFETVYTKDDVDAEIDKAEQTRAAEDAKLKKDIAESLASVSASIAGITQSLASNEAFIDAIATKVAEKLKNAESGADADV